MDIEVLAANSGLLAPTATDLMVMIENGETAEMLARVQTLGQPDYITVMRAVQSLEKALSDYALSWQNAEYWGNGVPYPGEEKPEVAEQTTAAAA